MSKTYPHVDIYWIPDSDFAAGGFFYIHDTTGNEPGLPASSTVDAEKFANEMEERIRKIAGREQTGE